MDNYQSAAIKGLYLRCVSSKADTNNQIHNLDLGDSELVTISKNHSLTTKCEFSDVIKIYQREDIFDINYILFLGHKALSGCTIFYKDGSHKEALHYKKIKTTNFFAVEVDFELANIERIVFAFINDIAEPLSVPIKLVYSDKELYYEKQNKEQKLKLLSNVSVRHSTGIDLVNIYFQPCCKDYKSTEIILYSKEGDYGDYGKEGLLGKYKVDSDVYFKSLRGLAFGRYAYSIVQYNANGEVLIQTDKIYFTLNRPNYGGKPTVVI